MKTLAERLAEVRAEKGLTQGGLAKAAGLKNQSIIGNLESGHRKNSSHIPAIAAALGVSAMWLSSGRGHRSESEALLLSPNIHLAQDTAQSRPYLVENVTPAPDIKGRIPLISWIRAGQWSEAVDIYEPGYAERWLPHLKNNGEHTYALRVDGDSMTAPYGKSYPEGCIIFVDPMRRSPSSGERIIAKLEGANQVTFKTYIEDAGRCWLKPLNPQPPPIMDPFRVLGTVIGKWEDD